MFQFKISFQGKSEVVRFSGAEDSTTILDFFQFIQNYYSLEELKILKLVKGTSIVNDSPELAQRLIEYAKPNKTKRITIVGVVQGSHERLEQQKMEQERLNEIEESIRSVPVKSKKGRRPKGVERYCYGAETKVDHVGADGRRKYCFSSTTVRKELAKSDQALKLAYSIVNDPALLKVMEKHKWHVDLVKEITPWEEPTKLGWNMNRGQNIALRLRSGREHFLTREEIMETMFHELAHMEVGPHNDEFRQWNDRIREDYFDFAYTIDEPEAFTGIGVRLGGSRAHRDASPKEMARRAALKRHVKLLYSSTCEYDHYHDHEDEEEVLAKDVEMDE